MVKSALSLILALMVNLITAGPLLPLFAVVICREIARAVKSALVNLSVTVLPSKVNLSVRALTSFPLTVILAPLFP